MVRGDGRLALLLSRLQVEGGRLLHRRVFDRVFLELRHPRLHEDEAPELAPHEVVHKGGRALTKKAA